MRHDANTRRIFVNEDMVRALMGALGEDVFHRVAVVVVGEREGQQPRYYGCFEPGRQRCVE
jgi:hypothetical protein